MHLGEFSSTCLQNRYGCKLTIYSLNLTAANRIFIVEPQWNPSVENQAIARAIRLRQSKKVLVTRYYIRETVEEEMRSQQVKKRRVALFGFAKEEEAAAGEALVAACEDVAMAPVEGVQMDGVEDVPILVE